MRETATVLTEPECLRGTLRQNHQGILPGADHPVRRRILAEGHPGIRGALSPGAQPPRIGQPAHHPGTALSLIALQPSSAALAWVECSTTIIIRRPERASIIRTDQDHRWVRPLVGNGRSPNPARLSWQAELRCRISRGAKPSFQARPTFRASDIHLI